MLFDQIVCKYVCLVECELCRNGAKFEAAHLLKFLDFRDGYGAKLKVLQSSFRTTVERGAKRHSFGAQDNGVFDKFLCFPGTQERSRNSPRDPIMAALYLGVLSQELFLPFSM